VLEHLVEEADGVWVAVHPARAPMATVAHRVKDVDGGELVHLSHALQVSQRRKLSQAEPAPPDPRWPGRTRRGSSFRADSVTNPVVIMVMAAARATRFCARFPSPWATRCLAPVEGAMA